MAKSKIPLQKLGEKVGQRTNKVVTHGQRDKNKLLALKMT